MFHAIVDYIMNNAGRIALADLGLAALFYFIGLLTGDAWFKRAVSVALAAALLAFPVGFIGGAPADPAVPDLSGAVAFFQLLIQSCVVIMTFLVLSRSAAICFGQPDKK